MYDSVSCSVTEFSHFFSRFGRASVSNILRRRCGREYNAVGVHTNYAILHVCNVHHCMLYGESSIDFTHFEYLDDNNTQRGGNFLAKPY